MVEHFATGPPQEAEETNSGPDDPHGMEYLEGKELKDFRGRCCSAHAGLRSPRVLAHIKEVKL
jgi:hypothetical protein